MRFAPHVEIAILCTFITFVVSTACTFGFQSLFVFRFVHFFQFYITIIVITIAARVSYSYFNDIGLGRNATRLFLSIEEKTTETTDLRSVGRMCRGMTFVVSIKNTQPLFSLALSFTLFKFLCGVTWNTRNAICKMYTKLEIVPCGQRGRKNRRLELHETKHFLRHILSEQIAIRRLYNIYYK